MSTTKVKPDGKNQTSSQEDYKNQSIRDNRSDLLDPGRFLYKMDILAIADIFNYFTIIDGVLIFWQGFTEIYGIFIYSTPLLKNKVNFD